MDVSSLLKDKCGNIFSLLILIGRGLDQDSYILNVSSFESTNKS